MDIALLDSLIGELEAKIAAIAAQMDALASEREEYERARDANRALARRLAGGPPSALARPPHPEPSSAARPITQPRLKVAATRKAAPRRHVRKKGLLDAFVAVMEKSGGDPLHVADIYSRIVQSGTTSEAQDPTSVMEEYGKRLRDRGFPIEPVADRPRTWRWVADPSPRLDLEQ